MPVTPGNNTANFNRCAHWDGFVGINSQNTYFGDVIP